MSKYMLYGSQLIANDDTMRNFALSVMRQIDEDSVRDMKIRYQEGNDINADFIEWYHEQMIGILYDDLARTAIDYSALMRKYAPEIGPLLCELENRGMDWQSMFTLRFLGEEAKQCFNELMSELIFLIRFGGDPLDPSRNLLQ